MNSVCISRSRNPLIAIASAVLITLSSSQLQAHETQGSIKKDGRFTPNVEGAEFPPQPRRVENVFQYAPAKKTQAHQQALEKMLSRVVNDPTVQQQLGDRYAHVHTAAHQPKGSGLSNNYRLVFFSHSNNQTVTVITTGRSVQSLDVAAAATEQPALAQSEHVDAIELARDYWLQRGKSSIDSLTGYAIQTFQSDGTPYPTRMVYVSFHTNSPEAPLLYNNVDLTNGVVVTGEEE